MTLTRRAFGLLGLYPCVAWAEEPNSRLFVPDTAADDVAIGRSTDRERRPTAWGIDDKQWTLFRAYAIASQSQVKVGVRLNNLRSRQFKDDLVELLASIPGWDIDDQGVYTAGSLPPFDGILIQNRSAVDPSPEALLIKRALDAAGIEPEAQFDPTQPRTVRVAIGAPPGG